MHVTGLKKTVGLFLMAMAVTPILAQTSKAMTQLGTYIRPGTQQASAGIWGYTAPSGKEYALLTSRKPGGVSIVDISAPATPKEINFIPSTGNSIWHEIHGFKDYIYKVSQENSDGLQIIDMKPLSQNKPAVLVKSPTNFFKTAHTLYIDTTVTPARLFVAYESTAGVMIFTLEDPENPKWIRNIVGEAHDMFARGDRLYVSNQFKSALTIWNIANVTTQAPVKLAVIDFNAVSPANGEPAKSISHNAWPSEDNKYLFTTEETAGTTVKAWDMTDISLTKPPKLVGKIIGVKGIIAHNVYVKGNLLFIAHYTAGIRVVDITDPAKMTEIAFHRPSASRELFGGTWGIYPWFKSGNIIHGDDVIGLIIEKPEYAATPVRSSASAPLLSIAPLRDGRVSLKLAEAGPYELSVNALSGRELFRIPGNASVAGSQSLSLGSRLAPGSYVAQVRQAGRQASAPLSLGR